MEIYYINIKLEKILKNKRLIKKYYGHVSEGLTSRMTELENANNLSLISHTPPPCRHKLSGKYYGYWAVSISKNYRLIFKALNGKDVLEEITEIMIVEIEDYH